MNDVADIVAELQGLDLDQAELTTLVAKLSSDGLTEKNRREVRAVFVKSLNRDVAELERYERILDAAEARDRVVETATKKAEKSLNQIEMRAKSQIEVLQRKVGEDVEAAKGGATLLLHTEDVTPPATAEPSMAPVSMPTASESAPTPKETAAVAMGMAKATAPVSPVSAPILPSSPSMPSIPANAPLPATMAPLPRTPIAPPAVTEPAAA